MARPLPRRDWQSKPPCWTSETTSFPPIKRARYGLRCVAAHFALNEFKLIPYKIHSQIGSQELAFFAVQTEDIIKEGKRGPTWRQLLSLEACNRATPEVRVRRKRHASLIRMDMKVLPAYNQFCASHSSVNHLPRSRCSQSSGMVNSRKALRNVPTGRDRASRTCTKAISGSARLLTAIQPKGKVRSPACCNGCWEMNYCDKSHFPSQTALDLIPNRCFIWPP